MNGAPQGMQQGSPQPQLRVAPGTPIPLTSGEREKLVDYLLDELDNSMSDHEDLEDQLDEWDRLYMGEPKTQKKTFPWPGAANVEIPIIGSHVDSINARILNTVFGVEPFWSIEALNAMMEPYAKPVESYLDWSRWAEFNMYRTCRSMCNELTKYGWAWLKEGWDVYTKNNIVTGSDGDFQRRDEVIRRPFVSHILARDVIQQSGVEDYEQGEWLCHRVRLTDTQLFRRKLDHVYDHVDEVLDRKEDASRFHTALRANPRQFSMSEEKLNTLYEFWVDWPWRDMIVPLKVVLHREAKLALSAVFNPYGYRPIRKMSFIFREGRRDHLGICRRLMQLQEEIGSLHRQQLDNGTIANTRFFVGRKNVIRGNTQIWPGRFLPVNDPDKDIKALQMGDIYQSQGVLEQRALAYAERASGISDYQLGRESSTAGSRATATGTLAIIQEGNRRFDLNVRDFRDVMGDVGYGILALNQMFRPRGMIYFVQGQKEGGYTEQVLNLPPEFNGAKLAIQLTASTASINKEAEKQGLLALFGIVTQYAERVTQAAMAVYNPETPGEIREYLLKTVEGARIIMSRIVQTFGEKDVDKILPELLMDEQAQQAIGGFAGNSNGGPPNGGMAGVPNAPQGNAGGSEAAA